MKTQSKHESALSDWLSCPFCGENLQRIGKDDFNTFVECGYCGARGEWSSGLSDQSMEIAKVFWNTRTR